MQPFLNYAVATVSRVVDAGQILVIFLKGNVIYQVIDYKLLSSRAR